MFVGLCEKHPGLFQRVKQDLGTLRRERYYLDGVTVTAREQQVTEEFQEYLEQRKEYLTLKRLDQEDLTHCLGFRWSFVNNDKDGA